MIAAMARKGARRMKRMTLAQRFSGEQFKTQKRAQGHEVWRLAFYDAGLLSTTIYADFSDETLAAENHIENPVKTAFGNNLSPSWADFQAFLAERCIPAQRAGLREYLTAIGLDEYVPMEIIKKTQGRMAEDDQWLEMEAVE